MCREKPPPLPPPATPPAPSAPPRLPRPGRTPPLAPAQVRRVSAPAAPRSPTLSLFPRLVALTPTHHPLLLPAVLGSFQAATPCHFYRGLLWRPRPSGSPGLVWAPDLALLLWETLPGSSGLKAPCPRPAPGMRGPSALRGFKGKPPGLISPSAASLQAFARWPYFSLGTACGVGGIRSAQSGWDDRWEAFGSH